MAAAGALVQLAPSKVLTSSRYRFRIVAVLVCVGVGGLWYNWHHDTLLKRVIVVEYLLSCDDLHWVMIKMEVIYSTSNDT